MRSNQKILWIVIVAAIVIYLLPSLKNKTAFAGSRPAIQEAAPQFSLTDLTGKKFQLSDFKGRVVLVNFFASWCPPCKMEIPGFENVYTTYKDRGFAVIGIATDDVSPSFLKSMGVTYPVVLADNDVISDYGNISSIPVSFLVGKDGRIIKKNMGLYFEASIKSDVEDALKGKP